MTKKYELTQKTIQVRGRTLHRIRALRDFGDVKAGDLGGYIEHEENSSHDGDCWVCDDAQVSGNAQIYSNAQISGNVRVYGNTRISGNVRVYDNAQVSGNARVYGNALIYDNAQVCDDAQVYGNARVSGNVRVYGNALVYGNARISTEGCIFDTRCYFVVQNIGSRDDSATFYLDKNKSIRVITGCFEGGIEEFRIKVKETHGNNQYAKEYRVVILLAHMRLKQVV